MIAFIVALALAMFLLGRLSCKAEMRDVRAESAQLRADLETWRTLTQELHEENCSLRKALL